MIIGITGKKRSGKDAFASFLATHVIESGKEVSVKKWAGDLKFDVLNSMRENGYENFTMKDLDGEGCDREQKIFSRSEAVRIIIGTAGVINAGINEEARKVMYILMTNPYARASIRELLQWYGTDIMRNLHSDSYWVDRVINSTHDVDVTIITDCRFDNEVDAVHSQGGVVVNVIRESLQEDETSSHISENGISPKLYDEFIDVLNNSTLEELNKSTKSLTKVVLL